MRTKLNKRTILTAKTGAHKLTTVKKLLFSAKITRLDQLKIAFLYINVQTTMKHQIWVI